MRLKYVLLGVTSIALSHPARVEPRNRIQTHHDPVHPLPSGEKITVLVNEPETRHLPKRDSITIQIENEFPPTSDSHPPENGAGSAAVNNAKNANMAVGDSSSHTADAASFGDQNTPNSTGSNTGGWNTQKNHGSDLTPGRSAKRGQKKSPEAISRAMQDEQNCALGHHSFSVPECRRERGIRYGDVASDASQTSLTKRDIVDLNIPGRSKVARTILPGSGNGHTVEVYVAGNADNVVNITLAWEAEGSEVKGSNSGNVVRVYIGDTGEIEMGNSTVIVAGADL